MRHFLNSKLRDIRITGTYLEYEGSITLDKEYMERAGFAQYEQVQVINLENGARFITYVITGPAGSGVVELNGPAARLAVVGDRIMVLSYILLNDEQSGNHTPRVVSIGDQQA
jgi:aspartate 1-decarboxylase